MRISQEDDIVKIHPTSEMEEETHRTSNSGRRPVYSQTAERLNTDNSD